jgi:hypothetical protein
VEQKQLSSDGSYSFDFKTRQEPTAQTGDFIIMLAVEGGTSPIYIDRIAAPKPVYVVKFVDEDGTEINQQAVVEGGTATLPQSPAKTGFDFVGWDANTTYVTSDMTIGPKFVPKKHTVIFVDWEYKEVSMDKFEHGSPLIAPEVSMDHYNFIGWADEKGNAVTVVNTDMILTAQYKPEIYDVTFVDWNGNVLSEQKVEYMSAAKEPKISNPSGAQVFSNWSTSEYMYVESDIIVTPVPKYADTALTPTPSVAGGTYNGSMTVEFESIPANTIIIYTTDGSYPSDESTETESKINGIRYSKPIKITKDTTLLWIAKTTDKNDSELGYAEYVIKAGSSESTDHGDNPGDRTDNNQQTASDKKDAVKSDNAFLKSIKKSAGKLGRFKKTKYSYKLTLKSGRRSVKITPKKASSTAKMQIKVGKNGKWSARKDIKLSIGKGKSKTVYIKMVSENKKVVRTYKVIVTRKK